MTIMEGKNEAGKSADLRGAVRRALGGLTTSGARTLGVAALVTSVTALSGLSAAALARKCSVDKSGLYGWRNNDRADTNRIAPLVALARKYLAQTVEASDEMAEKKSLSAEAETIADQPLSERMRELSIRQMEDRATVAMNYAFGTSDMSCAIRNVRLLGPKVEITLSIQ